MNLQIETAVKNLSKADEQSLYARLGSYSEIYPQKPSDFSDPGAAIPIPAKDAGTLKDSIELGKRILSRWNRTLYDLICTNTDAQAKKTIVTALNLKSADGVAAAITGILISTFSVGPAVATVVGVLIGRILLPAAGDEICKFWKTRV